MNKSKKHWAYYIRRVAFSIYQTLQLAKRTNYLYYQSKKLVAFAKETWYTILSLFYQLKGTYRGTTL